ncbi:MAG: hypothetical protein WC683_07155 [bacterium]
MPVIDEGSYSQFVQTLNAYQGQARQFALGLAQLKQAKAEFDQRMKFQKETFDFERQKWAAEGALNKVRLDAATEELNAFKVQRKEAEEGKKEFQTFNTEAYVPYLEALRSDDPAAVQMAKQNLDRRLATLSPAGQKTFYGVQQQALESKWYEPKVMSEIARNYGAGQSTAGKAKPDEVAKFLTANREIFRTTAMGVDPKESLADLDAREKNLAEKQEPIRGAFHSALSSSQVVTNEAISAALAGNLASGGGAANAMSVIKDAIGKSSGTTQKRLEELLSSFEGWRQELTDINVERSAVLSQKQLVDTFLDFSTNDLADAAVRGDEAAAVDKGKKARALLEPYGKVIQQISRGQTYAALSRTTDTAKRAALIATLRQDIASAVKNQTDKPGLHESLIENILASIDANTKQYVPAPAPTGNTDSKLGAE